MSNEEGDVSVVWFKMKQKGSLRNAVGMQCVTNVV